MLLVPRCTNGAPEDGQQDGSGLCKPVGGTRSQPLNTLALEMWEWCLQRNIWMKAEYLPGLQNQTADWESRHFHDYSNRSNHQIQKYIIWRPDPMAWKVDALSISWTEMVGYAFPPFCLIGKCIKEIAMIVLIAPVWRIQPASHTN